jgi:DNA-directed RNA polymerase specialized sigma subunit
MEKEFPEKESIELVFVQEPKILPEYQDVSVYKVKFVEEKKVLSILRPLFKLDEKSRLIYIGRHYFGMSISNISKAFKVRKSRVYGILQYSQDIVGRIQKGETVFMPRGDPRESRGE